MLTNVVILTHTCVGSYRAVRSRNNLFYTRGTVTLYSGHPWDVANWLLYKGGLIIQCTFNREVLFGTLLGGCFREVTFLYRFAIWLL